MAAFSHARRCEITLQAYRTALLRSCLYNNLRGCERERGTYNFDIDPLNRGIRVSAKFSVAWPWTRLEQELEFRMGVMLGGARGGAWLALGAFALFVVFLMHKAEELGSDLYFLLLAPLAFAFILVVKIGAIWWW